jgi:uncharacterized membrane protein HdeD (DUF308 family)
MFTPMKSLIFPTLSGALYVILSSFYFTYPANGFHGKGAVVLIGELTLIAGACTIAAGLWNPLRRPSWPLLLSGLFCSALGWMLAFWKGPTAFRAVALLIIGMAISLGIHEFMALRASRQPVLEDWLRVAAAIVSLGFAAVFLAFVLRLISLEPSPSAQTFLWIGSFFGFSAICMFKMALRLPWPALPALKERITY